MEKREEIKAEDPLKSSRVGGGESEGLRASFRRILRDELEYLTRVMAEACVLPSIGYREMGG
mgnify:CR=1 FL=1